MSSELNTGIKSINDWRKWADEHEGENTDWNAYCKRGDLVGGDVFDYFLEILPPRTLTKCMLQVGEPHSTIFNPKTGKYQETYATFIRVSSSVPLRIYRYCGNCFAGQVYDAEAYKEYENVRAFLKDTYSVEYGLQRTRPKILCKDGFEFSVQAGDMLYCTPRKNLESGDYEACEVGFPNCKEELLMGYIESTLESPMKSVYPYVPVEVIDKVISKHGGFLCKLQ